MTRPRSSLTSLALGALALGACGDEAPFELNYETEHLRMGVADDELLCAGELAGYERHITNVETWLSTTLDHRVDVYLWKYSFAPPSGYCDDPTKGCYFYDPPRIYSGAPALPHELVHAIAIPLGNPSPMLSEGVAEALGTGRTFAGSVSPSDNFFRDADDVDYPSAGHFTRWLWDVHGPELVRDLLTDTRDPELAFEALTGQTLEEAETDYHASAPASYAPLAACEVPALSQLDASRWSETVDLDCDGATTIATIEGLGSRRVLEVAARGDFQFAVDADKAFISRCADEDLLEIPADGDLDWGDVPPVNSEWPESFIRPLDQAGGGEVLDLVEGRYELVVVQTKAQSATIEVELSPSP